MYQYNLKIGRIDTFLIKHKFKSIKDCRCNGIDC